MIVVVGKVKTDAERRDELVRVALENVRASREDEGCLGYRFFQDTEDENAFVFVEEWESQEALEAHFRTPHIAKFMAAFPATLAEPPDVKFHTVASTVDIAQVAGGR
jgi:quinol monooxygenase YgiN